MSTHQRTAWFGPYVEMISGVKLYRDLTGRVSVSFCEEDRNHADLARRSRQQNARGAARGALDWASLTGKDARLWQAFRPLELARVRLAQFLQEALAPPALGFELSHFPSLDSARFRYWRQPGARSLAARLPEKCTDTLGLDIPGASFEVDVHIEVDRTALIYVQTFEEGEWERSSDDIYADSLVRSLDQGSAEARDRHISDFYLILVTPCRDTLQPYSMRIQEYRDHPDLLRIALAHRADLGLEDFALLAGRIGWTTWQEVEAWGR
jgi:hypothetical protein